MTEWLKPGERLDDLQCRGLKLIQRPDAFRFGTDSVKEDSGLAFICGFSANA